MSTSAVGHPEPGLTLLPIHRTLELPDLVAYAGATWDWHRLHYDHDFCTEMGVPAPVVDGQMFGALLVEQVQDTFGARVFVEEVSFRFAAMVFAGDTVVLHGTVTDVADVEDGTRITVEQTLRAEGREGERVAVKAARVVALIRA